MKLCLRIAIHGYWHAGTGRGEGPGADAVTARDSTGLPFLPGRTLKGLLREAVRRAIESGRLSAGPDDLERWFGTGLPDDVHPDKRVNALEDHRFLTEEGVLRFSSAHIGRGDQAQRWSAWAAQAAERGPDAATHRRRLGHLFTEMASTRIDENGIATDRTLRVSEVVVPLDLYATVEGPDDDPSWTEALRAGCVLLRAIGSYRRRGFGWCRCEIVEGES